MPILRLGSALVALLSLSQLATAAPCPERRAPAVAAGCAAVDLARRPVVLEYEIQAAFDHLEARLGEDRAYGDAKLRLERSRSLAAEAMARLRATEFGRAVSVAQAATRELEGFVSAFVGAHQTLDQAALRMREDERRLAPRVAFGPGGRFGDLRSDDMAIAWRTLRRREVHRRATGLFDTLGAFDSIQRAAGRDLGSARGTVAHVDDTEGTIVLQDGRSFAFSPGAVTGVVSNGRPVTINGHFSFSGSLFAAQIVGDIRLGISPEPILGCLQLRVVPVQKPSTSPTQHRPSAYESNGVLHLEQGMRLSVNTLSCSSNATQPSPGWVQYTNYGMKMMVEQSGLGSVELASWMKGPHNSAGFPAALNPNTHAVLRTTLYRAECYRHMSGFPESCDPPVQVRQDTHAIWVRPTGSYALAEYLSVDHRTTDDFTAGDFSSTEVTRFSTQSMPSSSTYSFSARGYPISGTGYGSETTVGEHQTFAIRETDHWAHYPNSVENQIATSGQNNPSGLRWGRVEGNHAGRPFWYYASLPRISRDLINDCVPTLPQQLSQGSTRNSSDPNAPSNWPPIGGIFIVESAEDTYYELPFPTGRGPSSTGLMNIDEAVESVRHPEWQAFALDLNGTEGESLVAARGGVVAAVVESDPYNGATAPQGWSGVGNFMFIRHEDDTYAVYFHLKQWGALVQEGQRVKRGEQIGYLGNTGNSSGPHVHFGVHDASGGIISSDARPRRVRFRGLLRSGILWSWDYCWIPRSGQSMYSSSQDASAFSEPSSPMVSCEMPTHPF